MNLQGGLFELSRSMRTPRQLSPQQQGLFDGLNETFAKPADINVDDPESLRHAAKVAMEKGDTVNGTRMMQNADQVEQRQAKGQRDNIKASYHQMTKAGRGAEFESAMIQAGKADIIADIKREKMADERLAYDLGSHENAAKAKAAVASYRAAKTPEAQDFVLDNLREEGMGQVAYELERERAETRIKDYDSKLQQQKSEYLMRRQRIMDEPVPTNDADLIKKMHSIPEDMRGVYYNQVLEVMKSRKSLEDAQDKARKSVPLPKEFIENAGGDYNEYVSAFRASPGVTNDNWIRRAINQKKDEGGKKAALFPKTNEYSQLSAMFDEFRVIEKDWAKDPVLADPEDKEAVIQKAWSLMQEDTPPAEAMQQAMALIPRGGKAKEEAQKKQAELAVLRAELEAVGL